jgi:DNA replication licensing factor MCM6
MDIDGSDSLPPSSSNPLQNGSATHSRTGTKSTRTRAANPMSLGDEDGADAMDEDGVAGRGEPEAEEDGAAPQHRRRRPKGQMNMDVPPVRDATGEKVMESFELFLKTYAIVCGRSSLIN